jgi:signal transduction histidine kinase/ActR/RegA family two-component response regulator
VYRADATLLASYRRSLGTACPATPTTNGGWTAVSSHVPVTRNGRAVGSVYVERTLSDLRGRVLVTMAAGMFMLLVAGGLALGLAHSLQRVISRPIVALAQAARRIGGHESYDLPAIQTAPDETGELVRAFGDMVQRLLSSNEALRKEVDERRRMQNEREGLLLREREASRLKDEFLAAVSHELRTPLNAILGWARILASTTPSEQTLDKAIASLLRNAQAQNRVIEDLLDVSRIITGKLRLMLDAVDLRSTVESAMEVSAPVASAKKIRLEADLPAHACVVQADYDRLRQVLWNLLSNAVKFTPAGGSVNVRLVEHDDSYAISVVDTGIGIAPGFLPHVFERFRQADGSTTRQHGGLGLGLAIVKELTELHGGTVHAESPGHGRGATFTVSLPRLPARSSERIDIISESAVSDLPRLDSVDVLAIDDNVDALDIVTTTLVGAGARVRIAQSGADALEQLRRAPAHIVLCDLAMPQMDGFEVLKQIQHLDRTAGRPTAVLAVSAYASDEYRERCLRAGFEAHLRKPFNIFDLVRAVAAAVART